MNRIVSLKIRRSAFVLGLAIVGSSGPLNSQTIERAAAAISDRGLHHRTWEWTEKQLSPSGEVISTEQHSYVELSTGLHRQTADGSWVETDPSIEVSADRQHGLVRNLQYQVIFAADLATPNSLDVSLPDGRRLTGHLLGVAYFDQNNSVMVAEPKSVNGEIAGRSRTELVFRDALTDFLADVQYVVERDRLAQNLILRQRIPSPIEVGLSENATLAILTEFTEAPALQRSSRGPDSQFPAVTDEQLSLGTMEFAPVGELGFRTLTYTGRTGRPSGGSLYRFVSNNPILDYDWLGLYELQFDIGDKFTKNQKSNAGDLIKQAGGEAKKLADELAKLIPQMKKDHNCCPSLIKQLEALKKIMDKIVRGVNSKSENLEVEQRNMDCEKGRFYTVTSPVPGWDPVLQLNTNDKCNWEKVNDVDGLVHELSHIYGTEDNDSEGELLNGNTIETFTSGGVEKSTMFNFLLKQCPKLRKPKGPSPAK